MTAGAVLGVAVPAGWRIWALAGGGLALGGAAVTFKVTDGTHAPWDTLLSTLSGGLFLLAGVVAARRRPENRTGSLMVLTGIALFAEDIQLAGSPALHTVGLLLRAASTALVAHLVLAFPTGVLTGRRVRILAGAAYAYSFVVVPLSVPLTDTSVPNLLLVRSVEPVAALANQLSLVIALAVVAVLVHRWLATRPSLRHVLTPVLLVSLVGGATAIGAGVFYGLDVGLYRPFVLGYQVSGCLLPLAFLSGVLRVRLGRTQVSRLVEALGRPVSDEQLRALLADALGDPGLRIGFRRADGTGLIDTDGRPLEPGGNQQVLTEVTHDGRPVAALLHDRGVLDDDHVLRAVTTAAGLALENQRLHADLRAQLAEVRASRARIVLAEQAERARIERDLHDGLQAKLVAGLIDLRRAGQDQAADRIAEAVTDLRRIAHGIRPAVLGEAGLVPALRALLGTSGLATTLSAPELPAGEPAREDTVYFVVAEALTNTLKHAAAHRFGVTLDLHDGRLLLSVTDDGHGGAVLGQLGGLRGVRDRLLALDGGFGIDNPPGHGTRLTADLAWPPP